MKYKLKSWLTDINKQDMYLYNSRNKCIGIIEEVTSIKYNEDFTIIRVQNQLALTIETKYLKELKE